MREIGLSSSRKISSLAFRITGAWVIKRKPEAFVSIFPISAGTCLRHTKLGGSGDSFRPLSLLRIPPQFLNSVSQLSSLPSEGISIHASCIPRILEESEFGTSTYSHWRADTEVGARGGLESCQARVLVRSVKYTMTFVL